MIFVAAMQQHPAASKQNTTKHNKTATNQTERTDFFLRFLYCFFFFFFFHSMKELKTTTQKQTDIDLAMIYYLCIFFWLWMLDVCVLCVSVFSLSFFIIINVLFLLSLHQIVFYIFVAFMLLFCLVFILILIDT